MGPRPAQLPPTAATMASSWWEGPHEPARLTGSGLGVHLCAKVCGLQNTVTGITALLLHGSWPHSAEYHCSTVAWVMVGM